MANPSRVIRLSVRAILAWAQGETDVLMQELHQKLSPLVRSLGVSPPTEPPKAPSPRSTVGQCPVHHVDYIRDDKERAWVCPEPGCGWQVKDITEISVDPDVMAVYCESQNCPRPRRGGGGRRKKRYKTKIRPRKRLLLDE